MDVLACDSVAGFAKRMKIYGVMNLVCGEYNDWSVIEADTDTVEWSVCRSFGWEEADAIAEAKRRNGCQ